MALAPAPLAALSDAAVAPSPGPAGPPVPAREGEGPAAVVALGPARPVVAEAAPEAPAEPGPAPEALPVAAPAPAPAPPSPEAPAEGGQGGPVAAGGPVLESCEGDEYVIEVSLAPEAAPGEAVEIVLRRFGADGSVDELELEGDLLDARNLALQLSSEGSCVRLEVAAPEAEATEGAAGGAPAESDAPDAP